MTGEMCIRDRGKPFPVIGQHHGKTGCAAFQRLHLHDDRYFRRHLLPSPQEPSRSSYAFCSLITTRRSQAVPVESSKSFPLALDLSLIHIFIRVAIDLHAGPIRPAIFRDGQFHPLLIAGNI